MNVAQHLPSHLFFSKFSHKLENGGVYAYFHALRMKPVYLNADMELAVERIRSSSDTQSIMATIPDALGRNALTAALDALVVNKVLVKDPSADEKVISHFRSSIPQPYPQIAYFILTENCNFGCSYCFVKRDGEARTGSKVMSLDTALRGLDFFCEQIARDETRFEDEKNIIFYGGEPLLNTKTLQFIVDKIAEYQSSGKLPLNIRLSIITNGSLLNEKNIELLRKNKVAIGISLDGDECATDSCRVYIKGGPVYQDVIKGIERCKKSEVPFSLSVTLTEQSVKTFDATLEELRKIGCKSLGFNILLTDENFQVAEGYNESAADCIIRGFEEFRKDGVYEDRMMRKLKSFAESKVYLFDCGAAGAGQIVIAPDGDVGVCHGFLGSRECFPTNVADNNFNLQTDPTFAEWGKRTPLNMPECQGCMALGMCGGGCPLNALKNTGSIWGMDERFCIHSKKTLAWLVWDLFEKVNVIPR